MIPISALSPAKRQFSNNRPPPLDPSVLRFSRLFQAADDEAVTRLRQIVDVHYRSAEIEGLLSELGEVDVSSDEDSDAMEWSLSEGQPPRTKSDVVWDVQNIVLDWIESIWQLCVERSDDFKDHDDWKPGHKLLKYLVNVALNLHMSPNYRSASFGFKNLKDSTGKVVNRFFMQDTYRDIIMIAMWVWRDILVRMLAEEHITKNGMKAVLLDIRKTLGDTLYGDLLDSTAFPRVNESLHPKIQKTIHTTCPHWTEKMTDSFNVLRRIYFSRHVLNFFALPNTPLYKHITTKSPAHKPHLLAHIDSLWSKETTTNTQIQSLKDQQINAIVGYYLTEHLNQQILSFLQRLEESRREVPFAASVAIAREFMSWAMYRDHAALIVQAGLFKLRDSLAEDIEKTTGLTNHDLESLRSIIVRASPANKKDLAISSVTSHFRELDKKSASSARHEQIDDLMYSRYLTWLDVMNKIPPPPPEHWNKSRHMPIWSAEYISEQFYAFTAMDGPLQWLTKESGMDLAEALVDGFLKRAHLRGLGELLRELAEVFALFLLPTWNSDATQTESGEGSGTPRAKSMTSSLGRARCRIG